MYRTILFTVLSCLSHLIVSAQMKIEPTSSISIKGRVLRAYDLGLAALDTFPTVAIPDMPVINHKGDTTNTLKELRGIPIRQLLESTRFDFGSPKELNTFYIVCKASDGYRAVFSWNELFNTSVGDNVFILTRLAGKGIRDMDNHIILISRSDRQTGRRFVKGLSSIEVGRLD